MRSRVVNGWNPIISTLAIVGVSLAAASPAPSIVRGAAGQRVDAHLQALEQKGFSGVALVAMKGEVILEKAYGLADRKTKTPFTVDTVFDIGSVTKQFTATAILALEEDGRLATTDTVAKYFPDAPADKQNITIHQLLTHSAGFAGAYGGDKDVAPRDDTMHLMLREPLLFTPGERFKYSNGGYSILAAIIELVTKGSYEEYLRDRLFARAGMKKTGYLLPHWRDGEIATHYQDGVDHGSPFKRAWGPTGPWWHLYGNGGILSTVGDMHRWEIALRDNTVLSPTQKKKLFTPYIPVNDSKTLWYCYGWFEERPSPDEPISWHTGGSEFGAWAAHYRFLKDDILVTMGANARPVPGNENRELTKVVAARVRGEAPSMPR